ncbi:uncharacterized protein At1g76070 [Ziziphus jujuba]|uniref:Uncharacterized protein At1g76070 n=2 Tax=Ziziphus jujuba TaxID=326968 RepID=A0A6P4A1W2_ZIZJJ|nr:uncharacterized protein At1g76070 [Ziziphus jujuba]KAH7523465.1 hypothetical protein FEM48_Zijuj06G0014100 [Ziziphus jujuba var. spinosa]
MEKQAKPKNNIFKFLPKAASVVNFQNPPFSPNREKRSEYLHKIKTHAGRGFSGPIISIIPREARSKPKSGSYETQDEPTSPKVSCMGQIKAHKKKLKKNKRVSPPQEGESKLVKSSPRHVNKHTASALRRIFSNVKPERKYASAEHDDHKQSSLPDRAPALSQMKRFASGRDSFSDFDWTAQIVSADKDHRDYYSDEDRDDNDHEDDVKIPFSAPIMVGGGVPLQPRKEINLWKRRTMTPPRPLQLHSMITAN